MSLHRFFCLSLSDFDRQAYLSNKKEIHHIKNVLRLKVGAEVELFNGKGLEAKGRISNVSDASIEIKILKKNHSVVESPALVLACAIPKKAKFETIIEKCTELGVAEIIPLQTHRTDVKFTPEQAKKKILRYQTVAINAAKQSKRATVPKIQPITSLEDLLKLNNQETMILIACLRGDRQKLKDSFSGNIKTKKKIIFIIGPEGDWTDKEIEHAIQSGCLPIDLGPTILKVDTAAIATISFYRLTFL